MIYFIIRFQVSGVRLKFRESEATEKAGPASVPANSSISADVLWWAPVFAEATPRHAGALLTLKLSLTPET